MEQILCISGYFCKEIGKVPETVEEAGTWALVGHGKAGESFL